ncbi:hypothetical protein Taro_031648 [Colocasia esculenta]|uniref:Aminotransferase-like plant mobile domain-containing protein n=1 Tax=Colocasia esculenta TaxID=4460 RepID=A0A843W712_COLES|nr:hypothetical protein [Colocasia esculenta]
MGEDIATAAPSEDEPIGPKKEERATVQTGMGSRLGDLPGSAGPPEGPTGGMGFGPFLRLDELVPDVALIQALNERWDPECHAFLLPWGHMIPTLEVVARITSLRVDGQAVTGVTYTSSQEQAERLLGLAVTRERSSLVPRTGLQESLGVANACHRTGEGQADYMARLTEDARAALAEEEGEAVDRDLRQFLIIVIGKLILGTKGDPVSCSLGTSSRETGVSGFFPLLQVWAYYHLPSLGRGVPRRPGAVLLLQRWRFLRDERFLRLQVMQIDDALDTVPFGHVQWTPHVVEDDAAQPWVERGRPNFSKDIWVHSFNTVVPLHHQLVAQTLGFHQAVLEDWEQRGREVASEATSDEEYFRAYARTYGAQVYKGSRRLFDPEGHIASLEVVLHSTIQQRDDLQAIVTQLREELDRAQQMVGGSSSSREDPGRSVLEGQLAAAVARAEDALAQVQERETELRNALAPMTTQEAEMAELRLRPEAAKVTRWR